MVPSSLKVVMVSSSVLIDGLGSSGFTLDSSLDSLVLADSFVNLAPSAVVASFLEFLSLMG